MHITTEAGKSSVSFGLVPKLDLIYFWQPVEELLNQHPVGIVEYYDTNALLNILRTEQGFDLWLLIEDGQIIAAAIMHRAYYPKKSVMSCLWMAGQGVIKHLDYISSVLESYSVATRIDQFQLTGRLGWTRVLKNNGFKSTAKMSKDIATAWRH